MSHRSLYAAERDGARVFEFGRVGVTSPGDDLGSHTYTGTFRSERISPAGPGGLVNFRRVAVHVLADGTYTLTIKTWVDDTQTTDGAGSAQTVSIDGGTAATITEETQEAEISAEGSHIRVEVTVDSDSPSGLFLIESITARGRVIRQGATRGGEST